MHRLFAITIIMLLIQSCEKKHSSLEADLYGRWELVMVENNVVGREPYPRGNGHTISFEGNTYLQTFKYPDTTFQVKGKFSIVAGKPCENADARIVLNMDGILLDYSVSGATFIMMLPMDCGVDLLRLTFRRMFF